MNKKIFTTLHSIFLPGIWFSIECVCGVFVVAFFAPAFCVSVLSSGWLFIHCFNAYKSQLLIPLSPHTNKKTHTNVTNVRTFGIMIEIYGFTLL